MFEVAIASRYRATMQHCVDSVLLLLLLLLLLLSSATRDAFAARGIKHQLKQGQYGMSKSLKNGGLFPPVFNVAAKAEIRVNATCGEDGPETFCKPAESLHCAICDSRSPDPNKRHNVNHALDSSPGRWWQSPTLARGDEYEYVTIDLELKQIYQIEYVIIKAANSPRPAAWILERSIDGEYFQTWQYYAPNDEECWTRYSTPPVLGKPMYIQDDEVICTSFYSRQTPMENGEIHTQLLNGRPGALNHTLAIQDFTQARFVRLRFQGLRKRGEAIVDKRRAFYSIREINIGGRCLCSGHSSRCKFNELQKREECECERHTCGEMCEKCCPIYNQIPWKSGVSSKGFHCEKCNCNGHAISCRYDSEVAERKLSMDIRGKYRGGGVCLNCTGYTTGINCEKCETGYYRPNGVLPNDFEPCIPCECHTRGSTGVCISDDSYNNLGKISTLVGWQVSDINAFRAVSPSLQGEHGWPTIASFEVEYRSPYWLAPKIYTGNHLSSYGSNLTFMVSWIVMRGDTSGRPTSEPDVVLIAEISVPIQEQGWFHVLVRSQTIDNLTRFRRTDYRGDPVTRQQMLEIIADIKYVLIRAQYHTEQIEGSLKTAVLPIGEISMENGKRSVVENCSCPIGYIGLSCESCDWGYVKVQINSSDHQNHHKCIKCDCNNHAGSCDLIMGECGICEHYTIGPKCDRCIAGYYGDATKGTPGDCLKCACPLDISSNNFSPNCQIDNSYNLQNNYVCTQCPSGYTGDHCEMCDVGFFGNPLIPGKTCEPCLCYGGPCNQETGQCLECRGNTEGWKCEKCKEAYFGNPAELNCMPCNCNPVGSTSRNCEPRTGQCYCLPTFDSRDCSLCIQGYGNVTAGCVECDCSVGAADGQCDSITGLCDCSPGTIGNRCDQCDLDHYGLSSDGCSDLNQVNRVLSLRGETQKEYDTASIKPKAYIYLKPQLKMQIGVHQKFCGCNVLGATSSSCDIITGNCLCKVNVIGKQCDKCLPDYWGLTTGAGCTPCECDSLGSYGKSCYDLTGQCNCKPGIGGLHCDSCLSGYFGFSHNGCQRCEPCDRPGHVCNPKNGRCSCPSLTLGERCDRCRPGTYDLRPGLGCRACNCSTLGSKKQQCFQLDGQCPCHEGFNGRRCDRCAPGHYDYPRCKPCNCDPRGSLGECNDKGQCPCKFNVIGQRCNQCKMGTFGLSANNSKGCTECFCFGRTSICQQANLSWGQRRLLRPRVIYMNDTITDAVITNYGSSANLPSIISKLNKINTLSVIPGTDGNVTLPIIFNREFPIYWELPESFFKDKIISYNGFLRFTTITEGGYILRSGLKFPQVQLQGNGIILEYFPLKANNDSYYIARFHESLWHLKNKPDFKITREILMIVLQQIQHIFVKVSDFTNFTKAILLEASMDAAVPTAIHSPPLAIGIEQCDCPEEYNGTSCQNPSWGYYRWHNNNNTNTNNYIELVGLAKPCQCNGRTEICDLETGHCLNCRENTAGFGCDICAESFYGDPNFSSCKECPCPQTDKKFSNSCIVESDNEITCICKLGYTGTRCERCAYGHYGFPTIPGGTCTPCRCNTAGSASDECDIETGQCNCKPGSTGRDCSQCTQKRHVFIGINCMSCNDNCTGLLLDDIKELKYKLINATTHVFNGYIAPPWEELAYYDDNITILFKEVEMKIQIEKKLKNMPWENYDFLSKSVGTLLTNTIEMTNEARIIEWQSGDIENNEYSLKMEIESLQKALNDTVSGLIYYENDDKKVEITKTFKETKQILNNMKFLDLPKRTEVAQNFNKECSKFLDWFNELLISMEPITKVKEEGKKYSLKLKDTMNNIENTMETMFSYDTLYNEINMTYDILSYQREEITEINTTIMESINKETILIDEARSCIINNETIIHAQSLSDYVDQYVGLFSETRAQAANPLKASQAYKNIVQGLIEAKQTANSANKIIDDVTKMVYSNGPNSNLLPDIAFGVEIRSSEQLEMTKNYDRPITQAKNQLENQKQSVSELKYSLNTTGNKDNQINVKLRELQSGSRNLQTRLNDILNENIETDSSIFETKQLIERYQQGIKEILNPKFLELKREGDSKISLASEKLAEAQSNIKWADAKLTSLALASIKRQTEFDKWNGTLASKLQILKDKINEARNTADGIRISVKSAEGKKCIRSYRIKDIQPSSITTLMMTISIPHNEKEGILFYLASIINDDYVALEMFERKIRFIWNIGGGTGIITHPEILKGGNPEDDTLWYRINAERIKHIGKLSVSKQLTKSNEYSPVSNKTSSEFGRFDISSVDHVWLGGLAELKMRPPELIASNGLPSCIHQVILNDKPLGLWNFISNAPDNACEPCVEGVESLNNDVAYSFNGDGYAVRTRVMSGPYNKYIFGVSINFKTFDENAILFLAIDPDNPNSYIIIFLREGHVILHIVYGNNISMEMSSSFRYNTGNWTKIDAFRQYQDRKNTEKCSFSVNGENDKKIGAPTPQPLKEDIPDLSNAKYFIGGVPPTFRIDGFVLPTEISFLGCMSNIVVQEGYDPMAEQYYGVELGCRNKPMHIVGFYGNGYIEHAGFQLRKISSSISFSFRTLQNNSMLLLSFSINYNYYSIAVIEGRIQVRLNNGKGEIILESNSTFNDGKYHIIIISKKRKDVELRIDDAYQTSKKLATGAAIKAPESSGLYFGGLPSLINNTKLVSTNIPLKGTIKDVIFDEDTILRFENAITFEHAFIGRRGPHMGKDSLTYLLSASSRRLSIQPEGCQKIPYYSLEPGALKFGDKPQSHTQLYLNFENFWFQKKIIEFDFRTYYPNGLLFITPGIRIKNYLAVIIRDGQLLLLIKSKQKKEILFRTPFNDGNWHHVTIGHGGRKLTMIVDTQTPITIKVPKKIGLTNVMYIGGIPESGTPLPEQVVTKVETLKGCIRSLKVNGNVYDMVGSTSRPYNVGQCFPNIEGGAYFQDEAYAIYKKNFELGPILELQLEFRTSELTGILLSITTPEGSQSLSLELHNGRIIMSSDFGYNQALYVEQEFSNPYTICDNKWHRIQAIYNNEELALKVDEMDQKYGLPANINKHFIGSIITNALYIGGIPVTAHKGTLLTRDHFIGCIRNVMIGGERRDWTDMSELHNIHLNSCPVQ
ncbi:PREDICTED: laminin subunit alpha-1 [Ceratosolen solmsi marchali]|uniref:Laminin subunit alpha-1 n=1 Tax=Ceratosolen solmsi marchali TaxID=326594 RepID=A0AAJ6YNA1_9HYME|nr:PREDICTED: laminin subunit alpha-1 [Ceratosolen solmsi marchali]